MTFADAVAVRSRSRGRYVGQVPPHWDIAGAANGGYLMALVANAVLHDTGATDPVTVTAHYLAPARPGAVEVEVSQVRAGRRLSTAQARLVDSAGQPLVAALATVGSLDELAGSASTPELVDAKPPSLPPLGQCVLVEPTETFPPPFMGQVRVRLQPEVGGFFAGRPSGRPEMRGWFSLPGEPVLGSLALLLAADAFPPTVFNSNLPIAWTPTVELTVQVRARPTSGALRCSFSTRFVTGGYLEADGEIWDADGRLLALSRQLALVPRG
jgi:acyl-CoA thioesterase